MDLTNCNIDYIQTCNNDNIGGSQPIYIFSDFSLSLSVFIYIHEYANYANMITCIFDNGMKGICLSFNLVQNLVIYG